MGLRPIVRVSRISGGIGLRYISTVNTTDAQEDAILVDQRKHRPMSPHLDIYKPQLTWVMSGLHRVTGVFLAAGFYALTCSYAAGALLGHPLDSAALVSLFGELPELVKTGVKAVFAFPFVYHGFNGVRHIVWDFGKELTLKGVYRTGYAVIAASVLVGSYLAFF